MYKIVTVTIYPWLLGFWFGLNLTFLTVSWGCLNQEAETWTAVIFSSEYIYYFKFSYLLRTSITVSNFHLNWISDRNLKNTKFLSRCTLIWVILSLLYSSRESNSKTVLFDVTSYRVWKELLGDKEVIMDQLTARERMKQSVMIRYKYNQFAKLLHCTSR